MGTNLGRYCGRNQCSLEEMKMCEKKIAELGLLRHGKRRLLEDRKEIGPYMQGPVCIFIVLEQALILLYSVILREDIRDDILHDDKIQDLE